MKLAGKKTYIVAGLLIIYAVAGAYLGKIDIATAGAEILAALGLMGLRNAI